jgi:hypothetical protein
MKEEKPTYKVTDRRLFNSDGTPREGVEREEPADLKDESAGAQGENTRARATTPQAATTAADADANASAPRARERTTTPAPPFSEALPEEPQDEPEADAQVDPAPFMNLVMFIASPAAGALGLTEHPGIPRGEIDLRLAKHCIDLLATLYERTQGNLGAQEQQLLENVLTELRMEYVSHTSTRPPAPPRGFSGKDIMGGS